MYVDIRRETFPEKVMHRRHDTVTITAAHDPAVTE